MSYSTVLFQMTTHIQNIFLEGKKDEYLAERHSVRGGPPPEFLVDVILGLGQGKE